MSVEETISRWDAYIEKIKNRCQEILAETRQAAPDLIDPETLDSTPLVNAWSAIELQLIDLSSQVEETWGNKVIENLVDEDCDEATLNQQGNKRDATTDWIDHQRVKTEIELFADVAKQVYKRAKEIMAKDYVCTQCSAPLPVPQQFFRSVHITCDACQKVNTFSPGTTVRMVEAFCADNLARERCQDEYFYWLDCEKEMNDKEDEASTKKAEQALRAYNEAFLRLRIKIVPEYHESYEKDLEGRMAHFYYHQDLIKRMNPEPVE